MQVTPWKRQYTVKGQVYTIVPKKDPLFGVWPYYESEEGNVLLPSLHDKISHRAKQIRSITLGRLRNPKRFQAFLKKRKLPLYMICIH